MKALIQPHYIALFLFSLFSFPAHSADPNAGASLADNCSGCHGHNGISKTAQWPNLAAQKPGYLVNQLQAFKADQRIDPVMQSMAKSLTTADINNLAAHFASLPPGKAGDNSQIAKIGQEKAGMCMGCHGKNGLGSAQTPRLAGQHADYLVKQLRNFKNGSRKNSTMKAISSNLSEEDMAQVAAFFASVP